MEKVVQVEDVGEHLAERENFHVSWFVDFENGWPFRVAALKHANGSRLAHPLSPRFGRRERRPDSGLGARAMAMRQRPAGEYPDGPRPDAALEGAGLQSVPRLAIELVREATKAFYLPLVGRYDSEFKPTTQLSGSMFFRPLFLKGEAYQKFVALCKKHGATINDGLALIAALVASRRSNAPYFGALYTVNGRRYLKDDRPIIANMSGVNTIVIPRKYEGDLERLIPLVASKTGEQKQHLPGLAFSLIFIIFAFWLPAAPLHWFARHIFGAGTVAQGRRFAAFTNVGAMDMYVEPFGPEVRGAWMLGAFQRGFAVPLVMASGFRDSLALCVCAADDIIPESVAKYAEDWAKILSAFSDVK